MNDNYSDWKRKLLMTNFWRKKVHFVAFDVVIIFLLMDPFVRISWIWLWYSTIDMPIQYQYRGGVDRYEYIDFEKKSIFKSKIAKKNICQ